MNRAGNRQLERDATDFLAQHLFELYTLADWPFLYTEGPVGMSARVFPLPEDFNAPHDERALRLVALDGVDRAGGVVTLLDPDRFDSCASLASGPPEYWMVDRSSNTGVCTPDPSGRGARGMLRYKRWVPDPSTADEPTDVPVFPWHNYLVQAVYVFALEHERDSRALAEAQVRDNLLGMIRRGAFPLNAQRPDIPLDPLVFRPGFRGD